MHNPHESKTDLGAPLDGAVMVLLVDDQAMIGEAVRRSLASEAGIDFHFCSDPQQAVAVANQIKPTVILQDLVMPGVDGLTLLAAYRGNPATRDIPIIVLSTKEEPTVKSAAFAAGANDYLVKLPDAIELVARIRYHSRSYIALQQRDEAYRALRESQQQLLETNLVLQRLMNSDGLTGLSNRRHFDEYLEMEWRRSLREQSQLSLLMIDVDYFKSYNDTFGHVAGDEASRCCSSNCRPVSMPRWCWCSMSTRSSPPAWPNGWPANRSCRCAWRAMASRRYRGRSCWRGPTITSACCATVRWCTPPNRVLSSTGRPSTCFSRAWRTTGVATPWACC